uniref:ShKT domain-containing protein n=1 Tax=Panagrolaimus sp. ES5 TaxID=591445 RepID=A0AC34GQ02_9BILA
MIKLTVFVLLNLNLILGQTSPSTIYGSIVPEGECIDITPDCEKYKFECTNDQYKPLMCKYCKKTCILCNDPCGAVATVSTSGAVTVSSSLPQSSPSSAAASSVASTTGGTSAGSTGSDTSGSTSGPGSTASGENL